MIRTYSEKEFPALLRLLSIRKAMNIAEIRNNMSNYLNIILLRDKGNE